MSSAIPSRSSPEQDPLKLFSQKLDDLPGDTVKVVSIMENILNERESPELEGNLAAKITELQGMFARPAELSKEINALALKSLRGKMKRMIESKISSLTTKQLCSEILTEIPPHRISAFVDTVEGFYHQVLQEGKPHQEALIFALSKGMLRSMVKIPRSDEIEANEELKDRIDSDPELKDYICPLTLNLVGSDAVYLEQRVDGNGNPRERYHEKALKDWIVSHSTDPVTRDPRTPNDIKPDFKGREFVEKKLCFLSYPELIPGQTEGSVHIEALHSKAFLLALSAAYSVIKKQYQEASARINDPHAMVAEVEASAMKTISRFTSIVEGMNWEGEEVVSPCFLVIKEFLKEAEKKLTDENLEEVRADLIGKLGTFVTFFHEIEPSQLSSRSQEKALKIAGEAISSGASFEGVREVFREYVESIIEEDEIRETFPGCLVGKAAWDTAFELVKGAGSVENAPLPPGMLDILNQDCPITPGKKVGETHTLVLIPSTVNGQPLTLSSLGVLVKSKGHFPATAAGYDYMNSHVAAQHGNTQTGRSHWALMTKDVLLGSRSKSYAEQQAMVATLAEGSGSSYEVPGVLDATACIFMNYLASPQEERLFLFNRNPWTFTRCQEQILGWPVVVGGFAPAGLLVSYHSDDVTDGVAALRKFWP